MLGELSTFCWNFLPLRIPQLDLWLYSKLCLQFQYHICCISHYCMHLGNKTIIQYQRVFIYFDQMSHLNPWNLIYHSKTEVDICFYTVFCCIPIMNQIFNHSSFYTRFGHSHDFQTSYVYHNSLISTKYQYFGCKPAVYHSWEKSISALNDDVDSHFLRYRSCFLDTLDILSIFLSIKSKCMWMYANCLCKNQDIIYVELIDNRHTAKHGNLSSKS